MSFSYNYLEIALNLLEYLNNFLIGKCFLLVKVKHHIKRYLLISFLFIDTKDIPENEEEIHKAKVLANTVLCTFRSYSNYSIKFCHLFHEFDGVQLLFDVIKTNLIGSKAFRSLLGALLNVARVHDEHLVKWSKTNCVQVILDLVKANEALEDTKSKDDHKLSSCKFVFKNKISLFLINFNFFVKFREYSNLFVLTLNE